MTSLLGLKIARHKAGLLSRCSGPENRTALWLSFIFEFQHCLDTLDIPVLHSYYPLVIASMRAGQYRGDYFWP